MRAEDLRANFAISAMNAMIVAGYPNDLAKKVSAQEGDVTRNDIRILIGRMAWAQADAMIATKYIKDFDKDANFLERFSLPEMTA